MGDCCGYYRGSHCDVHWVRSRSTSPRTSPGIGELGVPIAALEFSRCVPRATAGGAAAGRFRGRTARETDREVDRAARRGRDGH